MIEREKLAIIGASGFVGSRSKEILDSTHKYVVIAPSSKVVNITSQESVLRFFERLDAPVVVNLAAYTNVGKAEEEEKEARALNVDGARNLAEASLAYDKFLIHISTGYVIDRGHDLTFYGQTKLEGEEAILEVDCHNAIVRIDYPFGNPTHEKDYVRKILLAMEKGYSLYSDQWLTPTFIPDLVRVTERIVECRAGGIFQVATNPSLTPYEFGTYLAKKLGLPTPKKGLVIGKDETRYPLHGELDTLETERILDIQMSNWKNAVDKLAL